MKNKTSKILTIILVILLLAFIGGASYILQDQDKQAPLLPAQTRSINAPDSSDHAGTSPVPSAAPRKTSSAQPHANMIKDTPMAAQERPEPRQISRRLTEEQKQENLFEIAKMAEALPDNMWVPRDPGTGFSPERGERLRKSIELSDKIRKNTASPDEQRQYYTFKLKETADKIELIRYIAGRTEELALQSGKQYLTASDIDTGEERIMELEKAAQEFERKLSEIDPASGE